MVYTFTRHLVVKVSHERVSSIDVSQDTSTENQIQILKRHQLKVICWIQEWHINRLRLNLKECSELVKEGDEFTFTRVNRVCRNNLELQLLGKDLCDSGIILTATEQPISK